MSKKFSIFLSVLFCSFIGGILALSILLPDKEFSELENRYLQKPPKLSLESLESGDFMSDAEDYTADQIVGRDFWVSAKAWCERLSGKQENKGVYFGKNDTLLNRVDAPSQEDLDKKLGFLDTLVGNVSIPVYFGLIPTSSAIWADRLPAGAPTADELSLIDQMYFQTGATTIDIADALAAHSDEEIYYRTDHHWTSLGAFYGANAIFQSMGLEPLKLEDYTKTTVTDQFFGTTFSTSGVRWVTPDTIETYVPGDGLKVTSWFGAESSEGSLYVDSWLTQKDKYSYFLGGRQQPLCVIENPEVDGPKVMIIRDSYSDSLAPWLTQRFSEVHLFDPRTNKNSVKDYVQEHDIDTVMVLYSFSNFATDPNLFVLGR